MSTEELKHRIAYLENLVDIHQRLDDARVEQYQSLEDELIQTRSELLIALRGEPVETSEASLEGSPELAARVYHQRYIEAQERVVELEASMNSQVYLWFDIPVYKRKTRLCGVVIDAETLEEANERWIEFCKEMGDEYNPLAMQDVSPNYIYLGRGFVQRLDGTIPSANNKVTVWDRNAVNIEVHMEDPHNRKM